MPPQNQKELAKIARFCRKNGIKHYKNGDIELSFGTEIHQDKPPKRTSSVVEKDEFPQWDSLTDEQKLLWSSTPISEGIENA